MVNVWERIGALLCDYRLGAANGCVRNMAGAGAVFYPTASGRGDLAHRVTLDELEGLGDAIPDGRGVVMMDVLLTQLPLTYQIAETGRLRHVDQKQPAAGYQQEGWGSARSRQGLRRVLRRRRPGYRAFRLAAGSGAGQQSGRSEHSRASGPQGRYASLEPE